MSGLERDKSTVDANMLDKTDGNNNMFRRRQYNNSLIVIPRRYVIAIMLFILLFIQTWRQLNIMYNLVQILFYVGDEVKNQYASIRHWTIKELDAFKIGSLVAEAFVQIPGALLIFTFSSHKFFLVSVSASSLLHMLTPVALNHHTASLLVVLFAQSIFAAPINVAVMTVWKDWAPPAERTRLLVFSFYGLFVGAVATMFYVLLYPYLVTDASFYLSGVAGIIWTFFWYNVAADTPQNDPLISEKELSYLECQIPYDIQEKIKIKEIPWKSIVTSKQVLILCLIYFKMACSTEVLSLGGPFFSFHVAQEYHALLLFIPLLGIFAIFLPATATIADYLIKKFNRRSLIIRKVLLCGGFLLQVIFMFGSLANWYLTKAIFYMISYSIYAMSIPGFITLGLDLSPRYVAIIGGIIFTFYSLGIISYVFFAEITLSIMHLETISWIFLFDGIFSTLCAILFGLWGEDQEQPWSLIVPSSHRRNDYQSYPKPEDEDDLNLVPEIV